MIRIKDILNEALTNGILRQGFLDLIGNSHIVSNQVQDNIENFLISFDESNFINKFGSLKEYLGCGVFGCVFLTSNNMVIKFTFDYVEAPFIYQYCTLKKTNGFVDVKDVYKTVFGNSVCFIIYRTPLILLSGSQYKIAEEIIENRKQHIKYSGNNKFSIQVANAIEAMYNLDSSWRGTHADNLGMQNNKVVLYDGFSKHIRASDAGIPLLNLKIKD